jgi:hypothetical protein
MAALTSPYHDPIRFLGGLQIECALQALDPSGNVRALDRAGNHQRTQVVAFQDDALARVAIDVLEHVTQRAQAKRQPSGPPGCDRGRVLHLRRLIDAGAAGGCLLPRVKMHGTQLGHEFVHEEHRQKVGHGLDQDAPVSYRHNRMITTSAEIKRSSHCGQIVSISQTNANLFKAAVSGLDIDLKYAFRVGNAGRLTTTSAMAIHAADSSTRASLTLRVEHQAGENDATCCNFGPGAAVLAWHGWFSLP